MHLDGTTLRGLAPAVTVVVVAPISTQQTGRGRSGAGGAPVAGVAEVFDGPTRYAAFGLRPAGLLTGESWLVE